MRRVVRALSAAPCRSGIPASMRAVVVGPAGAGEKRPGPNSLACQTVPTPEPQANEVLVQVAAAGVARPDIMQRLGLYNPPKGHSSTLGLEVAGKVVAIGADAKAAGQFAVGDRVCGLANGGGYAEFCAIPHRQVLPVPPNLSMAEAACIPECFFTVMQVFRHTNKRSQRLFEDIATPSILVHGGTSGIGMTAIQLAKAFGAQHILTTAGSDEKCAFCTDVLGATSAINYRSADFAEVVHRETQKRGVDLVLDMVVGKGYTEKNVQVLAKDGRLHIIGFLGGAKVEANLTRVLTHGLTICGSTLRSAPEDEKAQIAERLSDSAWPLLDKGDVKVIIDSKYDLENAAAAHRRLEEGTHIGKVCLEVADL